MSTFWLAIITFITGFSVPTQTGINADLGKHVGSPVMASFISFCVGSLALFGYIMMTSIQWPSGEKVASAPWWMWIGGFFGALFVTMMIVMAPRLGATVTLGCIVAGQMLASLVFDHYGWLGFPEHPISWLRFIGVCLLIFGVFLIQRY